MTGPAWHAPESRAEALRLRADLGEEGLVVAGGVFLGILMNNGILQPEAMIALARVADLDFIRADGRLRIGAMTTHRRIEADPEVRRLCPVLARTFSLVANPRVRNWATAGGVLASADYASDPPSMLAALGASVVLESVRGRREVPVADLIEDFYKTIIAEDELLTEIVIPLGYEAAAYRKFRTRSHEDRPCVSVAAVRRDSEVRVVVGAVAGRPQYFADVCAALSDGSLTVALVRHAAGEYAARIEPLSDARGSAAYRRRVIEVEVRRALEELAR